MIKRVNKKTKQIFKISAESRINLPQIYINTPPQKKIYIYIYWAWTTTPLKMCFFFSFNGASPFYQIFMIFGMRVAFHRANRTCLFNLVPNKKGKKPWG